MAMTDTLPSSPPVAALPATDPRSRARAAAGSPR
jgi:hypothetical protein